MLDKRSFVLGMVTAFSECVAGGCKRLALSPPMSPMDCGVFAPEIYEIIEKHGILRCDKDSVKNIDSADIVSVRMNNFGAEVMLNDREQASYKYRGCTIDPASLDDIMLYYVHRDAKEWS